MTEIPGTVTRSILAPYLPRLVRNWSLDDSERRREIDGSLVSVDISGFTALSEQLTARGREGAEELVRTISGVFAELIAAAERHGGDVLKFRGDALLLLFTGDRHPARACGAASDMQDTIDRVGAAESSVGPFELRMSAGVHSGLCHLFLTEIPHRELVIAGAAATRVFELEDLAGPGQIVVSAETAAEIDEAWILGELEDALVLRRLAAGSSPIPPPPDVEGNDLEAYVPSSLRNHLAVASGEAEHRQVTIAFVKLGATDETLATEGPGVLLEYLDRVAAAVAAACDAYGLTWLESDIDTGAIKIYLTAGAPTSSGQDEEAMLRGVRDVLAACHEMPLCAGVHRGHVFTGDIGGTGRRTYAVMGDAVNLAARLTARARRQGILTTQDVLDRARTLYTTESEPLLLKGKERAVIAHHVIAAAGSRPRELPDATPTVGREAELASFAASVNAARMRQLQVIELVGEPGMGKSRLVGELRRLALGFQQLEAFGEQYAASEPYAAFRPLLRQLVGVTAEASREEAGAVLAPFVQTAMPDLAPWLPLIAIPFDAEVPSTPESDALDPGASLDRLHMTFETLLERMLMMPTLLVVEDTHWLDDASLFLLRHLVSKPAMRPWLICVTGRPGGTPLVAGATPGTRHELGSLANADATALIQAVASEWGLSEALITGLAERAGGNPLFVRELAFAARASGGLTELPESVESLLTARIDTLDPADRMLLRYAAVVGPTFELAFVSDILADQIAGAGDDARWVPLSEFVVPDRVGVLRFRHDLVRATAYAGLSFQRRRDIHERVGLAFERIFGERVEEEAALLSLHFHEAGDHERAWRYATLAADRAAAGFANVVASELYERALAAAEGVDLDPSEIARVEEALGDVCERFGSFERARSALRAALERADSPTDRARLTRKIAVTLDRAGRYEEAAECLEAAIALLDDEPGSEAAVRTRAAIERAFAGTRYRQARYLEAIAHADRAIELAEKTGNRGAVAHASYIAGTSYDDLGRPDGRPYLERAVAIYQQLGDDRGLATASNNLGIHHYTQGRWDEAVALYALARAADERAGDPVSGAVHANNEAEVRSDQGRLDEAEPLFVEMVHVCRAAGFPIGVALGTSNLGRVAARRGSFAEAHALYADAEGLFGEIGARRYVNETRARVAEVMVFEGRYAEALETAQATLEAARETPFGGLEALVERMAGYALVQARRNEEGSARFEESLRIARELSATYEEALTLRAIADTGGADDADAGTASNAILARLGIVSLPHVPLP